MKKTAFLLLTAALLLSMTACRTSIQGSDGTTGDQTGDSVLSGGLSEPTSSVSSNEESTGIPERNDEFHDFESAQVFVEAMGVGWNLGNSLDPVDCTWVLDELEYETAWDNPKTTRQLIAYIKSEGFDTIRIPVTWTNHVGDAPEYPISRPWMRRVQEIVDWCMEEDLYVIINMQHDDGWLNTASVDYENVMTKYKAIWTQIALRFRGYSEKLIFESMNEIGFEELTMSKGCALLNKINAEFTELVRSTGGNNEKRYLLLAGYLAEIDKSIQGGVKMPDDDRTILSLHYYLPPTFAIADSSSEWGFERTWGTSEDFRYMREQFEKIKRLYVDKGIPVIIGEFGTVHTDKDMEDVVLYTSSIFEYALKYHMCPIWWDNGSEIDRIELSYRVDGMREAVAAAKERGLSAR